MDLCIKTKIIYLEVINIYGVETETSEILDVMKRLEFIWDNGKVIFNGSRNVKHILNWLLDKDAIKLTCPAGIIKMAFDKSINFNKIKEELSTRLI